MHRSSLVIIPIAILILGGIWYASTLGGSSMAGSAATTTDAYAYSTSTQEQAPAATSTQPITQTNQAKIMQATLHTNEGDITFEFNPELSPTAVANFTKLAQQGFYNGTKFHRVIKGFMIQGGDPLTKDDSMMARWGTGGPGYQFPDEITANSHNSIGMVSMANSGPNTNGSQFYINTANNSFLDGKYTVFAHVTSGMDVVTKIENMPTGQNDRPNTAIVINSIDVK